MCKKVLTSVLWSRHFLISHNGISTHNVTESEILKCMKGWFSFNSATIFHIKIDYLKGKVWH